MPFSIQRERRAFAEDRGSDAYHIRAAGDCYLEIVAHSGAIDRHVVPKPVHLGKTTANLCFILGICRHRH